MISLVKMGVLSLNYRAEFDWAPAHELVLSLDAYLYGPSKGLDLGAEWGKAVAKGLPESLSGVRKWANTADPFLLMLLVWQCPGDRSAETFLSWLQQLTPGQLYERLAPYLPDGAGDLLRDLAGLQSYYVSVLTAWLAHYAGKLESSVLAALAADAELRKASARALPPLEAVDQATTGLMIESEAVDTVLLIPQHHFRPLNRFMKCGRVMVCAYPVEIPLEAPGVPSTELLRLTRALGDENRLRILHYLGDDQPHSFTDVHKMLGLGKTTVHYHLSMLRAAGLVRIHLLEDCGSERYTARRATLEELAPRLKAFLDRR